jgi:hypothetical protein
LGTWLRIEARQLDQAAVLVADLGEVGERHGFDLWRRRGAFLRAVVETMGGALSADHVDATKLAADLATITTLLDTFRMLEMNTYSTIYDAVLGRLLIAAGQAEAARERLDIGLVLAQDTGMHFYDAELLRLRAQTHDEPAARQADINAALELARRQGATLFELRAALDDFELRGESASAAIADAANRIPANSAWPELARAKTALRTDATNLRPASLSPAETHGRLREWAAGNLALADGENLSPAQLGAA